jgi:hypothetical protein
MWLLWKLAAVQAVWKAAAGLTGGGCYFSPHFAMLLHPVEAAAL